MQSRIRRNSNDIRSRIESLANLAPLLESRVFVGISLPRSILDKISSEYRPNLAVSRQSRLNLSRMWHFFLNSRQNVVALNTVIEVLDSFVRITLSIYYRNLEVFICYISSTTHIKAAKNCEINKVQILYCNQSLGTVMAY